IVQEHPQVPSEIISILRRSCYDCHSNETVWPWYSAVAPASWLVVDDVTEARKRMNFSEWGSYKMGKVLSLLEGMCEEATDGGMPLKPYVLLHPSTGLSELEIKALCGWSEAEAQRLTGGGQD
ncbi:MAG: heme-binding domain-containing protein, partial [Proteobacteria bacterium]|nr:heme-binding domain-containing protein [Pseudomonadota bacterium]